MCAPSVSATSIQQFQPRSPESRSGIPERIVFLWIETDKRTRFISLMCARARRATGLHQTFASGSVLPGLREGPLAFRVRSVAPFSRGNVFPWAASARKRSYKRCFQKPFCAGFRLHGHPWWLVCRVDDHLVKAGNPGVRVLQIGLRRQKVSEQFYIPQTLGGVVLVVVLKPIVFFPSSFTRTHTALNGVIFR